MEKRINLLSVKLNEEDKMYQNENKQRKKGKTWKEKRKEEEI